MGEFDDFVHYYKKCISAHVVFQRVFNPRFKFKKNFWPECKFSWSLTEQVFWECQQSSCVSCWGCLHSGFCNSCNSLSFHVKSNSDLLEHFVSSALHELLSVWAKTSQNNHAVNPQLFKHKIQGLIYKIHINVQIYKNALWHEKCLASRQVLSKGICALPCGRVGVLTLLA